jgi:hypothetical protein
MSQGLYHDLVTTKAAQATLSMRQRQQLSRCVVRAHPSSETLDNCWSIVFRVKQAAGSRARPHSAAK